MASQDSDWLVSARQLDTKILGEIYDALSPEIYRYAYRLVGEVGVAEDVVAETFLRFLRVLQGGGGPSAHLRAYLYRVAHNLAMDHHRQLIKQEREGLDDTMLDPDGPDPALEAERAAASARAREALWHLTQDQRQVIVLKYFQGLSNQEISAVLEKSIGAVKALQHRALAALRKILAPTESPFESQGEA
jgi:RNA polymerase sigma-70 factor (ECF subfamily)